jgi:hypothetical protein
MTNQPHPNQPRDVLDELVEQLLMCGGVLSQMINHMAEYEASGRSAPDTPPLLEVAHELIRSVLGPVSARHPGAELEAAAQIVEEVTTEICDEIFFVDDSDGPPCKPPRMVGLGPLSDLPRR